MEVTMTIRPLYDRIVVKRMEEKQQMQGGLHIPDSAKEKPQEAEVTAVGKGKRLENGTIVPLDVKVGDRVLLGKYAGNEIKVDGQDLLILREDEVLGILQAPAKLAKAS
jgi:chaperonin GroES